MMSCMISFYLTWIALVFAAGGLQGGDPDALYRQREQPQSAAAAEQIWSARLARDPRDVESAWKLARARYWLGGHADAATRKTYLEGGIAAGRAAVAAAPDKPEGHFWIAANMGTLAEAYGLRQGLKYRGKIKEELETVLKRDPGFMRGSADRALGRWYNRVPGLFGGSNKKSEEHLRKSLSYDANSTVSHFFLAQTLLDEDRNAEAIEELKKVLAAPYDADWEPEDREYKQKASDLLSKIRR